MSRANFSFFRGTITLKCDGGPTTHCEFDGSCDAAGLGATLGVAARSHMQKIAPELKDQEFRALLAAFVTSTADPTPLEVKEGSVDMILITEAGGSGRPS